MVLLDGQYEYFHPNGLSMLMGAGTPYRILTVDGLLSSADIDSGNEKLRGRDGFQRAGRATFGQRMVTLAIGVEGDADGVNSDVELRRHFLMRVIGNESDQDGVLVFKRRGLPEREVWCAPAAVTAQGNYDAWQGYAAVGLQLRANDPVIYSPEFRTDIEPSDPSVGRPYPRLYPLTYGEPVLSTALVENIGNRVSYRNRAKITGPLNGVLIRNMTLGMQVDLDLNLNPGDVMEIDFLNHNVLVNGANRRGAVVGNPEWFGIAPGENVIFYQSSGLAGVSALEFYWRQAWASA
jgi:hypothetical protein